MLRISRSDSHNGSVGLRLEGDVTGPWVNEMSQICRIIMTNEQRLRIDLADVAFVDRRGVELLAGLERRRAILDNCSPFLKAQLRCASNVSLAELNASLADG